MRRSPVPVGSRRDRCSGTALSTSTPAAAVELRVADEGPGRWRDPPTAQRLLLRLPRRAARPPADRGSDGHCCWRTSSELVQELEQRRSGARSGSCQQLAVELAVAVASHVIHQAVDSRSIRRDRGLVQRSDSTGSGCGRSIRSRSIRGTWNCSNAQVWSANPAPPNGTRGC